jgi:hypothetical protein
VPPQKQLLGVIDQLVADRGRFPAPRCKCDQQIWRCASGR